MIGIKTFALILLASLWVVTHANAQTASTPQVMLTWQAEGSYTPPSYQDKALPNIASHIIASVMLVTDGRPADLSGQTIYWYQNDILIGGGEGMTSLNFTPFGGAPDFITLKVELPSYDGAVIDHEIQIPVVQPKAVIEAQHPSGQFSSDPLVLQATPYFFDITDPSSLSYTWSVNGTTPGTAENPETLQVNFNPDTSSGSTFSIGLTLTDPATELTANDSTNLTYVKEL